MVNRLHGNDVHFNFGGVATAAIGGGLGGHIGDKWGDGGLSQMSGDLIGANTAAWLEDKWFGAERPDYKSVSLQAIASAAGRFTGDGINRSRFGEWLQKSAYGAGERIGGWLNDTFDQPSDWSNDLIDPNAPLWATHALNESDLVSDYTPLESMHGGSPMGESGLQMTIYGGEEPIQETYRDAENLLRYTANREPYILPSTKVKATRRSSNHMNDFAEAIATPARWLAQQVEQLLKIAEDPSISEPMRFFTVFMHTPARLGSGIVSGVSALGQLATSQVARNQLGDTISSFLADNPYQKTVNAATRWMEKPWYEQGSDAFVVGGEGLLGGALGRTARSGLSAIDYSPHVVWNSIDPKFGQAGAIGIGLARNPKLKPVLTSSSVPNLAELRYYPADVVDASQPISYKNSSEIVIPSGNIDLRDAISVGRKVSQAAIRSRVLANLAASKAARDASSFGAIWNVPKPGDAQFIGPNHVIVANKFVDINPSKKIGGRKIINSDLAGTTVKTKGGDVRFDSDGFPDFTPYSQKTVRVNGLTGDMANDVPLAMGRAGITTYDKSNYVWHHHQDAKTMMLVPRNVHSVRNGGVAHTGGRAVIEHNMVNPNNVLNYLSPDELF